MDVYLLLCTSILAHLYAEIRVCAWMRSLYTSQQMMPPVCRTEKRGLQIYRTLATDEEIAQILAGRAAK